MRLVYLMLIVNDAKSYVYHGELVALGIAFVIFLVNCCVCYWKYFHKLL